VTGVQTCALPISPDVWVAALAMVLAGFGNGLTFPMTVVIIQRATTDSVRGRAFTLIISAHNAVLGGAMVAAGAVTEAAGPRWVYVIAAASLVVGGFTAAAFLRARQAQAALAGEQAA